MTRELAAAQLREMLRWYGTAAVIAELATVCDQAAREYADEGNEGAIIHKHRLIVRAAADACEALDRRRLQGTE